MEWHFAASRLRSLIPVGPRGLTLIRILILCLCSLGDKERLSLGPATLACF